jgi:hypothetical protein
VKRDEMSKKFKKSKKKLRDEADDKEKKLGKRITDVEKNSTHLLTQL